MDESLNVFGEALESCSERPMTGFFRDGCCNTSDADVGCHTVCVKVNKELSSPMPEFEVPGLQPGDRWCLCAARWLEAHEHGMAPRVYLRGTHKRTLEIVPLELLREFAADLN
jgi:uncharacterized protein (DUF2237 family)